MALHDAGWPERPLDLDRTAVMLGSALGGEHALPHRAAHLAPGAGAGARASAPSFAALATDVRAAIESELRSNVDAWLPPISEDTMPGELANCTAGRIANLFNLHGPELHGRRGLRIGDGGHGRRDGGPHRGATTTSRSPVASTATWAPRRFVKFCAIGALSPTGTRPYADGADGFVMGEGAALFVLKRLADAERDGDRIYAVVRGIGGASDGRGKGITAPNPVGQRLAIERAWAQAACRPLTARWSRATARRRASAMSSRSGA